MTAGSAPSGGSPRRLVVVVGMIALVAVAAAVLFMGLRPTVPWSERVALDETPPGFGLSLIYDSADLEGAGGDGTAVLWAGPDATYDTGTWVAVSGVPVDTTAGPIDIDAEFPGEDRAPSKIGGVPAMIGTTFDDRPGIVVGPIDEHLVSLVGHEITAEELTALAAEVRVVDGMPTMPAPEGLTPIATAKHATIDATTSLVSDSIAPGEGSALVTYQPEQGTTPLQVSNRPLTSDRQSLVRFFLGRTPAVEVDGRDAWAGPLTLADYTINVLALERGGRLITLASERAVTELAGLAAGIEELSLADWEALQQSIDPPG